MKNPLIIETVDDKNISTAVAFIAQYEYTCVSLMARLLKCAIEKDFRFQEIYIIRNGIDSKDIQGVFLITEAGIVLHHLLLCNAVDLLRPILKKRRLFSLAGTSESSSLFEAALKKNFSHVNNYYIMTCTDKVISKNSHSDAFTVLRCTLNDINKLSDLQMKYQIEEVLPPGKTISESVCRRLVKDRLTEHTVYAIFDIESNKYVSMAGTNANGQNYSQLGGIYTDSKYRNLGMAQTLVKCLIQENKKFLSLFVRTDNASAIKAYSNVGFTIKNTYKICYI